MSIQIGSPAPAFTLFNSEKAEVSMSQFIGKNVVILFYPQAFTSVCTEELCSMRGQPERIRSAERRNIGHFGGFCIYPR